MHEHMLRERILVRALKKCGHMISEAEMARAVALEKQRQKLLDDASKLAIDADEIIVASFRTY